MILANTELFRALDDGRLRITPEPTPRVQTPGGPRSPFSEDAVDLRLGCVLQIPKRDLGPIVLDLTQPGSIGDWLSANFESRQIQADQPFRLEPDRFVLGKTLEHVTLPIPKSGKVALMARVEGKSSYARIGLAVHITAPTIHAGYGDHITLEFKNLGPAPILLIPGSPIVQLVVEEVRGIPSFNPGQFQKQTSADRH